MMGALPLATASQPLPPAPASASASGLSPALAWLLTALCGTGAAVSTSARIRRPVLRPAHLLLPHGDGLPPPDPVYAVRRAAVAHAAGHLLFSPAGLRPTGLKPMSVAVISAVEDARVDSLMMRRYPGLRAWLLPTLRATVQRDGLSFGALIARMSVALLDDAWQDDNHWVNKARERFRALHDRLDDYAAFRQAASVLANDLGQMRVRFDLNSYVVPAAYRDDNSYLWEFGASESGQDEAPLELASERPPPPPAAAPDRAAPPATEATEAERSTRYPEWDHRLERYRDDWCTVVEQPCALQSSHASTSAPPPIQAAVGRVALKTRVELSRGGRLRGQLEGETLDLDAAIAMLVERRRGLRPEPRLFIRPGRGMRPLSLLLLVDMSRSTNDVAPGATLSVLDTEKTATLLLARAALACGHRVAIHGFSSDTRACVNYFRLLDFGQPLDAVAERAVLSMRGAYSTRLGAAMRHAASFLLAEACPHRAILVVTDGAPADIDVHDARYLPEDARQAVRSARRQGIHTSGVVVDSGAAGYARTIFGHGNYCIADSSQVLPVRLSAIYARIVAN